MMEKEEILMSDMLMSIPFWVAVMLFFFGNISWAFVVFLFWLLFVFIACWMEDKKEDTQPKSQILVTSLTEPAADSGSKTKDVNSSQCPNCGGKIEPDALFCENCGIKLG